MVRLAINQVSAQLSWQLGPITIIFSLSNQIKRRHMFSWAYILPWQVDFHDYWCDTKLCWQDTKQWSCNQPFSLSSPTQLVKKLWGNHEQTMEASKITCKQLITMPKMYIFWFVNQAYEPKWGNLGKCGLEGTKEISNKVSNRGLHDWHLAWGDIICPRKL